MALPKKQKIKKFTRINSYTHTPLNTDVPENKIVKVKNYSKL